MEQEEIIRCPNEPLLNVPKDCTANCDKCIIGNNGGLYNRPCGYID